MASPTTVRPGPAELASSCPGMNEKEQAGSGISNLRGSADNVGSAVLEQWLVDMLVCPVDQSAVSLNGSELICNRCGCRYPVRDGIPNMVSDLVKSEQ